MLKYLRNRKTAKRIWIFLAVIIVPPFVLWGSGNLMNSNNEAGPEYVGKLFGRNVPIAEFQEAYDTTRNQLLLQYGEDLPKVASSINIENAAWERILLLGEAKKRNIRISDQEVIDAIAHMSAFQYQGVFNERAYNETITYALHMRTRDFEEQTRKTLMIGKLFEDVSAGITVSEQEVQEEYRKLNEKVSIWYVESLIADFEKKLSPTQEELKAYFEANSLNFKIPLSFNLSYVEIPTQGKDDKTTKHLATSILELIKKKHTLKEAAATVGLTIKESGLFAETDPIPGIGWSSQLSTAIFRAKPGEYLPMIASEKSQFIMQLKERKAPYVPELAACIGTVEDTFRKEKGRELAKAKIEECLAKIKDDAQKSPKAADLEKAAKALGLKASSAGPFNFGSYIEGIGASDNFWLIAESLKEDEVSQPLPTQAGFYLIKMKSKDAIDEKKFAQEKEQFTQKVIALKKQELFGKFITELKEKSQRY